VVNEDLDWLPMSKMECKPEMITEDPAKCVLLF